MSGSTAGSYGAYQPLDLIQQATGGAGGSSSGGAGGQGGAATSNLVFDDTTNPTAASLVTGISTAAGGAGGSGATIGGAGGAATASIALTAANSVSAAADATGAAGGSGATGGAATGGDASATSVATATSAGSSGTATSAANATGGGTGANQGSADASASAITANGQLASATSAATGNGGEADTTATTSSNGVVDSVSAAAQAQVGGSETTISQVDIAGTAFGFNGGSENSYSFATGAPSADFLSSTLAGNANVNAELGTAQAAVFGYGVQGGYFESDSTGSQTYHDSIDWTIDATGLTGHLVAGLISNQTFGAGFSSLQFSVDVDGSQLVSDTFTTLASAQSFFSDQTLDLGAFANSPNLTVDFNFDLVASTAGDGFGEDFLLGATGGNGPPVIAAPTSAIIVQSHPTPIPGLSLLETGDTTGDTFTVTLADTNGDLSASGSGVSGPERRASRSRVRFPSEQRFGDADRHRRRDRVRHDHCRRQ